MHAGARLPCSLARSRNLDVQLIADVEHDLVKGECANAREPPPGSPRSQKHLRRARQRPPALAHMNQRPVVAGDANPLAIYANRDQLARSHEAVMPREESGPSIHPSQPCPPVQPSPTHVEIWANLAAVRDESRTLRKTRMRHSNSVFCEVCSDTEAGGRGRRDQRVRRRGHSGGESGYPRGGAVVAPW